MSNYNAKIAYKWKKTEDNDRETSGHFFPFLRVFPIDDTTGYWCAEAYIDTPTSRTDPGSFDVVLERTFVTKQDAQQWLIGKDMELLAQSLLVDAEYADAERRDPPQD